MAKEHENHRTESGFIQGLDSGSGFRVSGLGLVAHSTVLSL